MTQRDFTYALLRYVPDPERMEPLNFGVVVQGTQGMRLKLNTYFGQLGMVDAKVYRKWREFLEEEVEGEQKSIFRPSRDSADFWKYLRSLTGDTVIMTSPLKMATSDEVELEQVVVRLYDRLVNRKSSDKDTSRGRPGNPTFEFRRIRDDRKLDKRGLLRGHGVRSSGGEILWTPYRAFENGHRVAINKVEVNRDPELTNAEIGTAKYVASIGEQIRKLGVRWVIMFDPLDEPLPGQDAEAFRDMKDALESSRSHALAAKANVLSSAAEVQDFVVDIEGSLQPMA